MQQTTDDRGFPADRTPDCGYRGRFAPTPSGPLHLGSLLTAVASWLEARRHDGRWLLRIDDLDRPRCPAGTDALILRQLEAHGLHWDESPRYQTGHVADYEEALERLTRLGLTYPCSCTRAQLAETSLPGPDGPVYAGSCQTRTPRGAKACAIRFRLPEGGLRFEDGWQGLQQRDTTSEVGDFVLRRSDGMIGYQLACAVDEHQQGITEVVRGADLLGSTFRQIALMQALQWQPPAYRHGPLLTDTSGLKLSKQNHARALEDGEAGHNLWICLQHLQQEPPPGLQQEIPSEILAWATRHWRPENLLRLASRSVELA